DPLLQARFPHADAGDKKFNSRPVAPTRRFARALRLHVYWGTGQLPGSCSCPHELETADSVWRPRRTRSPTPSCPRIVTSRPRTIFSGLKHGTTSHETSGRSPRGGDAPRTFRGGERRAAGAAGRVAAAARPGGFAV